MLGLANKIRLLHWDRLIVSLFPHNNWQTADGNDLLADPNAVGAEFSGIPVWKEIIKALRDYRKRDEEEGRSRGEERVDWCLEECWGVGGRREVTRV